MIERINESFYPDQGPYIMSALTLLVAGWEGQIFIVEIQRENAQLVADPSELIAKVYPFDTPKAAREYQALQDLHGIGFPVPRPITMGVDESFSKGPIIIMEKINGRTLQEVLKEEPWKREFTLKKFAELFFSLHRINPARLSFDQEILQSNDPYVFVERELKEAETKIERFGLTNFIQGLQWLKERKQSVPCLRSAVIHRDFHHSNLIFTKDNTVYVVDWTNCQISDPRVDVAWSRLLMSGLFDPEEIRAAYEKESSSAIENIEYFDDLVALKRLIDIIISINIDPKILGIRSEVVQVMIGPNILYAYDYLKKRIGLSIPELESRQ